MQIGVNKNWVDDIGKYDFAVSAVVLLPAH